MNCWNAMWIQPYSVPQIRVFKEFLNKSSLYNKQVFKHHIMICGAPPYTLGTLYNDTTIYFSSIPLWLQNFTRTCLRAPGGDCWFLPIFSKSLCRCILTTTMVCRGLLRAAAGNCWVVLKTVKYKDKIQIHKQIYIKIWSCWDHQQLMISCWLHH